MVKLKKSNNSIPVLELTDCLAKTSDGDRPGCDVLTHLIYVGAVASGLWERLSSNVQRILPKSIVVSLAALHDLGKISPGFQGKIWRNVEKRRRGVEQQRLVDFHCSSCDDVGSPDQNHAFIGYCVLKQLDEIGFGEWSFAVGAHHGNLPSNDFYRKDCEIFGGFDWQKLREEAIERVFQIFDRPRVDVAPPSREQKDLATAFVVVSDWLGSDERFIKSEDLNSVDLFKRADEILDEIGWTAPKSLNEKSFSNLFSDVAPNVVPNEVQRVLYETAKQPGLFIVEAPTGCGKTEAALWSVWNLLRNKTHSGVYFALPTRTTSDKIYERFSPFLARAFESEDVGSRLLHSLAWTRSLDERGRVKKDNGEQDEESSDVFWGHAWFRPSKRALLQSYGVGTVDQALMGVLPIKHAFLRLFGLAGKVLIVDEAHSYDSYTGALLDNLISRLAKVGSSAIILSATLTQERRRQLLESFGALKQDVSEDDGSIDPYPMISYCYADGTSGKITLEPPKDRFVTIERTERDQASIAERPVEHAERGELVLCVANTIDKAQSLYRAIKSSASASLPGERIILLHGRFPAWRREQIEKQAFAIFGKNGDRASGAILVSTQIVEQSVDIDADYLITDLAPTDMLIQRIGRLWRHSRSERRAEKAVATVVYPVSGDEPFEERLGADAFVYPSYVLWRSAEEWSKRDFLAIPSDIRKLIEDTYRQREEPDDAQKMRASMKAKIQTMLGKAGLLTAGVLPIVSDRNEAPTRYNESETLDLLLITGVNYASDLRIHLSSGESVVLDGYRRLQDAISLTRNVVTKRKRRVDEQWIKDFERESVYKTLSRLYFAKTERFVPIILDALTGKISTLDGREIPLAYSNELGLYDVPKEQEKVSEAKRKSGLINRVIEEDEENDEFYEDFEW